MVNFERLLGIKNSDEWKKIYHEEIEKLDRLYQEEERLYYLMYAQGNENKRIDEIQKIKHELMTNQYIKENISSWKEVFRDDSVWNRRLEVFLTKMNQEALDSHPALVQLQQQLQSNLLGSSIHVNGKEYNLGTIHSNIMDNPNRELREQLLSASKKIGEENEELFRTLIEKRNELANDFGYRNYYYFRCSLKEIDIVSYINEMSSLLEETKVASKYWDQRIKEKFGWKSIHHYDQYFSTFNFHHIQNHSFRSDRMKEVLNDVVSRIGIAMNQLPISIESIEIPYGGFCININPKDIKLVVNKRDSYSVFLSGIHELGHAIDGYYSSYQYPELYRFYSSIAAEGIAELFQTIVTEKNFLLNNFDLEDEEYIQIEEINQLTDLKMVKMNLFYSLVEYEIYNNPKRNFQEIGNECYKSVFGFEGETFHPASEMFYIENPAFFQDYNFALAIRDMIRSKFNINSLYGNTKVFQEVLEKYINPNQLNSWQQRIESLCGEAHTFSYLKNRLVKKPQR